VREQRGRGAASARSVATVLTLPRLILLGRSERVASFGTSYPAETLSRHDESRDRRWLQWRPKREE